LAVEILAVSQMMKSVHCDKTNEPAADMSDQCVGPVCQCAGLTSRVKRSVCAGGSVNIPFLRFEH